MLVNSKPHQLWHFRSKDDRIKINKADGNYYDDNNGGHYDEKRFLP